MGGKEKRPPRTKTGQVKRCEVCGCPLLPWLTVRQAAGALQVSTRHVRNLASRGNLEWTDKGDMVRVRHESIHEMLDMGGPEPDWWVEFQKLQSG